MSIAEPMTGRDGKARPLWSDHIVTHIRRWGSNERIRLAAGQAYRLGSSERCEIRVVDKDGLVSREHAALIGERRAWVIQDLGSKNGTWVDGALETAKTLQPGSVIQVGDVKLVAESSCVISLYQLLCRLMGWAVGEVVDTGLQDVRRLATKGVPLILEGAEDLKSVAARIHRVALGEERPFHEHGGGDPLPAIAEARGGSICLPAATRDTSEIFINLLREQSPETPRLLMCRRAESDDRRALGHVGLIGSISIPPLGERAHEMFRIVTETAEEIGQSLHIPMDELTAYDHERFRSISFSTQKDLYWTLERLLLIRGLGVTRAALHAGRTHPAMSQFLRSWMNGTAS